MNKTVIEWTDYSWNPVTGCTKVGPGCANCYAEAMTKRFGGDFSKVTLHPERLDQPLRWRKPRRIFVCSMGDLFHEEVPDEFIADVWNVMNRARQHTFQVLTKRPERMRRLLMSNGQPRFKVPHPHLWLGVSVENQRVADERIPLLLQTPAAVRFVSCEPQLEGVDLIPYVPKWTEVYRREATPTTQGYTLKVSDDSPTLNWVIAGGESGPKARPARLKWFRSLRDDCHRVGIPYFQKQLGSVLGRELGCRDRKGGDMEAWPEDLKVREWPDGSDARSEE